MDLVEVMFTDFQFLTFIVFLIQLKVLDLLFLLLLLCSFLYVCHTIIFIIWLVPSVL